MKKPAFVRSYEIAQRQKRFALITTLVKSIPPPVRILDVGGASEFWNIVDCSSFGELRVTLLNLFPQDDLPSGFKSIVGDARYLDRFIDQDFDLVISNSVIGHVGSFADQQLMADGIRRIAPRYFVQTPNHNFPVDWRTLIPLFHFLPLRIRALMLYSLPITPFGRISPYSKAIAWADCVRNLTFPEVKSLFPDAVIVPERVLGFSKSFMAVKGLGAPISSAPNNAPVHPGTALP